MFSGSIVGKYLQTTFASRKHVKVKFTVRNSNIWYVHASQCIRSLPISIYLLITYFYQVTACAPNFIEEYIFFAFSNSLVTQSLLVTDSFNSDVYQITSQVAVLVGSIKKKYTYQDIVGDFDMIQSYMDKIRFLKNGCQHLKGYVMESRNILCKSQRHHKKQ